MYIQLTKGRKTLVDKKQLEKLLKHKWHINAYGYAQTAVSLGNGKMKKVLMHRLLKGFPRHKEVDHINGDKLDNRLVNLRVCSPMENRRNRPKKKNNTSGFKGVSLASRNRWKATIRDGNTVRYIGIYKTKEEAYAAYCKKCEELHKEFAHF